MHGKDLFRSGNKVRALATVGLFATLAVACDPGLEPETSHVRVLLTDAPTDMLESAHVWISHIYLQGGEDDDPETPGGRVDLFNDPEDPHMYDLLQLQDGMTADLTGSVEVFAGLYQGLRLVVDSARVTLAEGYMFEDGSMSDVLKVPSGSESGIKVQLNSVLRAEEGEEVTITVDFDVDRNFVIKTNPQTGEVSMILFTPVLKEMAREEAPAS